jgi:glycosyltransferase involved in cell wall biosynthesis
MPVPALFVVPFASDVGYAIETYVAGFHRAVTFLNDGDASHTHVSFTSITSGPRTGLPPGFANVLEYDFRAAADEQDERLRDYVQRHGIRVAMLLDAQPLSPLVTRMRRAGIECVVNFWGAEISSPFTGLRLWLRRVQLMLGHRRRADTLIFESEAMAQLAITGRGCPRSMIEVVYPGVDTTRFHPDAEQRAYVRREFGIRDDQLVVLYSGHVNDRKGVHKLVEAIADLVGRQRRTDLFFLICGNKGDEAAPYEERLRAAGVERQVRFAGYRRDMPRLMAGADIGVLPSFGWESFTMSVLEMQASGLPLVVSRLGGLPEAVAHERTGFVVEPGNVAELERAISRLADDDALRRRMGQNGRERVVAEFSLEVHQARLAAAIRRHLPNARAAGVASRQVTPASAR